MREGRSRRRVRQRRTRGEGRRKPSGRVVRRGREVLDKRLDLLAVLLRVVDRSKLSRVKGLIEDGKKSQYSSGES